MSRRDALEAGLTETQRKIQAEVRGFRRRMRALASDRERYCIKLAELDAFVEEKLFRQAGSPTAGVPPGRASRRRRPASTPGPSAGEMSAEIDRIAHEAEPEHSDAESGDRIRRYRAALERGMIREMHRRMLWRSLLLRQRIIMASDPGRPNAPATLAEARQVIAEIDRDARSQLTEAQAEVRRALIDLLPSPGWLSSVDDTVSGATDIVAGHDRASGT